MSTLTNLITRVSDGAGSNVNVSGVSARITRFINQVCQERWMNFPWPFRWRTYRIALNTEITDVTSTQTATATNGSRTVTFTASIGISSNVYTGQTGWYIVFPQDTFANFYKVRVVTSNTQLEMDAPYQGTTGSGKKFTLRQLDYLLPSEMADVETIIFTFDNHSVPKVDLSSLELLEPLPLSKGGPVGYALWSSSVKQNTYTTGTVSGTINTYTLTGSGTSWLANIFPGDQVVLGSYTYSVYSVDSDTQITLYQQLVAAVSGSTYTAQNQYQRLARIIFAADQNYTIDVRYLRTYWPLINNSDLNELTYFYDEAVVASATAKELGQKGDKNWVSMKQAADLMWDVKQAESNVRNNGANVRSLFSPYRYRTYARVR